MYLTSLICILILLFFDKAQMIKSLLSMKIWRPLSSLTLIAYLIYPIVISMNFNMRNDAVFISYMMIFYFMVMNIFICFLVAFFLYIFIQAPIANMIQLISYIISSKQKEMSGDCQSSETITLLEKKQSE